MAAATTATSVDYGIDAPLIARGWFGRAGWALGGGLLFWFMNRQEYPGPSGRVLGALALIFAFWDTHRILVSLLVMGTFLLLTIAALWMVVVKLRTQRTLFAATLSEFAKDRELLKRRP